MKGIVNIAGEDNRFVFQGVHMLMVRAIALEAKRNS